jgi:hypothetical protein
MSIDGSRDGHPVGGGGDDRADQDGQHNLDDPVRPDNIDPGEDRSRLWAKAENLDRGRSGRLENAEPGPPTDAWIKAERLDARRPRELSGRESPSEVTFAARASPDPEVPSHSEHSEHDAVPAAEPGGADASLPGVTRPERRRPGAGQDEGDQPADDISVEVVNIPSERKAAAQRKEPRDGPRAPDYAEDTSGNLEAEEAYELSEWQANEIFANEIVPTKLSGAEPRRHPEAVFLIGQQGAGKTVVAKEIAAGFTETGGFVDYGSPGGHESTRDPQPIP